MKDRLGGAFLCASLAVDARLGIYEQHHLPFMKTIARTNGHALRMLTTKTRFRHDKGHVSLSRQS